jgi:hypothetical protein
MSRNLLFVAIGALLVVCVGLVAALYQERQKASGFEITVGPRGIAVDTK